MIKKIEFGYTNDYERTGSWEGMGIKEGLLLTDAEYYGAINYGKDSFIVAKVVEDEYRRYPQLVGDFIVRPAIADIYPDGSGFLYLDQEQSRIGEEIERYLNNIRDRISDYDDILRYCDFVQRGNRLFNLIDDSGKVTAISIRHDIFEIKNTALKNCHQTFSDLQRQAELTNINGFSK